MSVPDEKPRLPNDTMPRLAALVIRSKPSTERPRLSTESELRLEGIEAEKAACYASMEEMTYQFQDLTNQLRDSRSNENASTGVVEIQITDNGEE